MTVHLVNPSHLSFGVGVITPRWLFVLAGATPASVWRARASPTKRWKPFDIDSVQPGDVVGVGHSHRQRAAWLRDRHASASAWRDRGVRRHSRHALPGGGAESRRRARGRQRRRRRGLADRARRRGARRPCSRSTRPDASMPIDSSPARWDLLPRMALHVGLGPDGARLPQALLVLLGLADRRPEAATARRGRRHRRDRRAPSPRFSFRGAWPTTTSIR